MASTPCLCLDVAVPSRSLMGHQMEILQRCGRGNRRAGQTKVRPCLPSCQSHEEATPTLHRVQWGDEDVIASCVKWGDRGDD